MLKLQKTRRKVHWGRPKGKSWKTCRWVRDEWNKPPGRCLDGDTVLVSINLMTETTSKQLHEQTAAMLDRAKGGQRMKVIRNGQAAAWLVPASEEVDPSWDEIMVDVRKARLKGAQTRPNPILAERKQRHYAARAR